MYGSAGPESSYSPAGHGLPCGSALTRIMAGAASLQSASPSPRLLAGANVHAGVGMSNGNGKLGLEGRGVAPAEPQPCSSFAPATFWPGWDLMNSLAELLESLSARLYPEDVRDALKNGLVEGVLSGPGILQPPRGNNSREFSFLDLRMHYLYSKTLVMWVAFSAPLWLLPFPGLHMSFRVGLFLYTLYGVVSAALYRCVFM